jgi:deoxyribodipyrimidine photo-lyase
VKGLVWFRSDLRTDDNPALKSAFEQCDEVIAIYLYSPTQAVLHNESNIKNDFIIKNLKSLGSKLESLNVSLVIKNSEGFNQDPSLINLFVNEHDIEKVYLNKQFGFDENERDKNVISLLTASNIDFEKFNDQIIYEAGFLKTGQGNPFSVFTPFKRRWVENFDMNFLDIDYQYKEKSINSSQGNFEDFNYDFESTHGVDMSLWPHGEESALKILNEFLATKAPNYSANRNDPIIEGTSRISPYLATGVISSRRCILEALKLNNFEFTSGNKGYTKWIDEIVWREFYRNIMHSFPKVSKGMPFQDYTRKIVWRFDQGEFDAWKDGMTGFPIIDAAMRQLKHEGWMHNRLRMVAAMFFTKNMLHDWRLGEKFFMESLIDGDFASNNGGWQWSSSTGTDAAPYFRIFNPITQSTNFDKAGDFIRKYVPELKDLDQKVIHDPSSSLRSHLGYPEPILDLKQSRLRAIDAFKESRE